MATKKHAKTRQPFAVAIAGKRVVASADGPADLPALRKVAAKAGAKVAVAPGPARPNGSKKPQNVAVHTWFERDRALVEVRDQDTGKTLCEWVDEGVQEAIDDGYLNGRDIEGSAIKYCEENGIIGKKRPYVQVRPNPGGARQRERGVRGFSQPFSQSHERFMDYAGERRQLVGKTNDPRLEIAGRAALRAEGLDHHRRSLAAARDYRPTLPNGVYDPGILKAVFLAGGPGSGKSYVTKQLFGVPSDLALTTASSTGLKLVNSDPIFEHLLRQHGIDPKDLATMPPDEFRRLTEGPNSLRKQASRKRNAFRESWINGRLGLIIDGTGDDPEDIAQAVERLRSLGYDCFMVFVNTSLEVAQQRNAARGRSLPAHLVEAIWRKCQQNIGAFQRLFGAANIAIRDATFGGPIEPQIEKQVAAFLRRPVENRIGKEWVLAERAAKVRHNGDMYRDLGVNEDYDWAGEAARHSAGIRQTGPGEHRPSRPPPAPRFGDCRVAVYDASNAKVFDGAASDFVAGFDEQGYGNWGSEIAQACATGRTVSVGGANMPGLPVGPRLRVVPMA